MADKECNLLTAKDGVLSVTPYSDLQIRWELVSPEFRQSFSGCYGDAKEILESDIDVNQGLNYMSVLERIGNLINTNQIKKEESFYDVYDKATELILQDLEIA